MVLGDNIFFGHDLPVLLAEAGDRDGGTVFGYQVADPERYGVVAFDGGGRVLSIEEKPARPKSNFAVTGVYVLDGSAPARAARVRPSDRGELEITDLLNLYLAEGLLRVERMGRGFAWLDTGTHASLLDAGNFVRTIEERQNLKIGCPEEIAHAQGWIYHRGAAGAGGAVSEDGLRPIPGPDRRRRVRARDRGVNSIPGHAQRIHNACTAHMQTIFVGIEGLTVAERRHIASG